MVQCNEFQGDTKNGAIQADHVYCECVKSFRSRNGSAVRVSNSAQRAIFRTLSRTIPASVSQADTLAHTHARRRLLSGRDNLTCSTNLSCSTRMLFPSPTAWLLREGHKPAFEMRYRTLAAGRRRGEQNLHPNVISPATKVQLREDANSNPILVPG